MINTADLQSRFGIPGIVSIAPAAGGLPAVTVSTALGDALIYLHGAHVAHFQPHGSGPILFLSKKSLFAPGKAIRGGIPVIFPWFGPKKDDPKAPSHGFARTTPWTLGGVTQHPDQRVTISLTLRDDEATRARWPHAFELEYRVTVGAALTLELRVRNPGPDAFTFEEAFHSYYAVGDARRITIEGLAGRDYLDKTQNMSRFRQTDAQLKIDRETDSHYLAASDTVTIIDPAAGQRRIRIEKENSDVTVVWNPWIEKAKAMSDLSPDDWQDFVCVETANAYDFAVKLNPGAEHTMTARIGLT
jgi:glucose-6-phosphate 1-epimerase